MSMHLAVNKTDISPLHNRTSTGSPAIDQAVLAFPDYFHAFIANTHAERQTTFRLRHKVYCEELSFEPLRDNGMEQDIFDGRAVHSGISHSITGQLVGTVRLITSDNEQQLLPIEQFFADTITDTQLMPSGFKREHICEISRLAVPSGVRCNINKTGRPFSGHDEQCCKLVAVALYLLIPILCQQHNRYHCYVMIEPRLARSLRRIGIHFIQIGDMIDYNGLRAAHYIDIRTLAITLKPQYQQLKAWLAQQLDSGLTAADCCQRTA